MTADPQRPTATGISLADLLLGLPLTATGSNTSLAGNFNGFSYAFFAQDDWKMNRRLTVNAGLRYDLNLRYTDVQDRLTLFDPSVPGGRLLIAGSSQAFVPGRGLVDAPATPRGLIPADKNNWGPRIGLAFRPFNDNKTATRLGYGIFFDTIELQDLRTFVRNPPFGEISELRGDTNLNSAAPAALRVADLFPVRGSTAARPNAFGPSASYPDPYYQQWNAGIERELPGSITLEIGYLGSTGTRLVQRQNYNQAVLDADPLRPTPVDSRRRFPLFGNTIRITEPDANSTYHGLIAKVEKRLSRGLSFLTSYTFAKTIDGGSLIDNQPRDLYNKSLNKARANFDIRQRAVFSATWQPPLRGALLRGWQINTIVSLRSGFPFSISAPGDPCNCAAAGQLAEQVGDPHSGFVRDRERWFNTAVFAVPERGTFGSSGRNILDGPGESTVNLSLFRSLRLAEGLRLQFRAEAFNLLNRTNFGQPASQVGSPNYGVIQASGDPRNLQFGLKLLY